MRSNVTPRVLIADDQAGVLVALKLLLKGEGYQIEQATSPQQILNALEAREFDLVLMDLNYTRDTTSGQEGLDLLNKIATIDPTIPVVVMTAWGSVELAVEAVGRGARDFIPKPWENARLLTIVKTQLDLGAALRKGTRLEAENRLLRNDGSPLMIAGSEAMQPVLQMISRIGPSDANILITGEPGTGKEVVARTLYAQSNRSSKPMVTVNAGGLAEGVFESELFGHVRGRNGSDGARGDEYRPERLHVSLGDGDDRSECLHLPLGDCSHRPECLHVPLGNGVTFVSDAREREE